MQYKTGVQYLTDHLFRYIGIRLPYNTRPRTPSEGVPYRSFLYVLYRALYSCVWCLKFHTKLIGGGGFIGEQSLTFGVLGKKHILACLVNNPSMFQKFKDFFTNEAPTLIANQTIQYAQSRY